MIWILTEVVRAVTSFCWTVATKHSADQNISQNKCAENIFRKNNYIVINLWSEATLPSIYMSSNVLHILLFSNCFLCHLNVLCRRQFVSQELLWVWELSTYLLPVVIYEIWICRWWSGNSVLTEMQHRVPVLSDSDVWGLTAPWFGAASRPPDLETVPHLEKCCLHWTEAGFEETERCSSTANKDLFLFLWFASFTSYSF